jgi:hypothetical protein
LNIDKPGITGRRVGIRVCIEKDVACLPTYLEQAADNTLMAASEKYPPLGMIGTAHGAADGLSSV